VPYEAVTLQKNDHLVIINVFGLGIDRVKTDQISRELSTFVKGSLRTRRCDSIFFDLCSWSCLPIAGA